MNDYEEKKQARIERIKEAARKKRELANLKYNSASNSAKSIPFGQPILVGHHSEKSDRNFRNKIENNFRKSLVNIP